VDPSVSAGSVAVGRVVRKLDVGCIQIANVVSTTRPADDLILSRGTKVGSWGDVVLSSRSGIARSEFSQRCEGNIEFAGFVVVCNVEAITLIAHIRWDVEPVGCGGHGRTESGAREEGECSHGRPLHLGLLFRQGESGWGVVRRGGDCVGVE
jgi:hypothetical protein